MYIITSPPQEIQEGRGGREGCAVFTESSAGKAGREGRGRDVVGNCRETEVGVARLRVATAIPLRNLATHATREGVWEEKQQAALLGEEGF